MVGLVYVPIPSNPVLFSQDWTPFAKLGIQEKTHTKRDVRAQGVPGQPEAQESWSLPRLRALSRVDLLLVRCLARS